MMSLLLARQTSCKRCGRRSVPASRLMVLARLSVSALVMLVAAMLSGPALLAQGPVSKAPPSPARVATPEQVEEYQRKLAEYKAAHDPYEAEASAYWASIGSQRHARAAKRRTGDTVVV